MVKDLLRVTSDEEVAILGQYKRTTKTIKEDIRILREWIKKHHFIPRDLSKLPGLGL